MFLRFEQVSLHFSGVAALSAVDLEIPQGGIFAIIGPNGAGKTTLLNCVSRFYTPQEGRITFLGRDLLAARPYDLASLGIARSFQNVAPFGRMTVEENMLVGLHHTIHSSALSQVLRLPGARAAERQARAQARDVMEQLGILEHSQRYADELPYGVQKRLDVGRALVSRPKLLLLDEPAAGMNEQETAELGEWILGLPAITGVTIVMVEHDMSLVMGISQRVAVLDFGRLIAVGAPQEVASDPAVVEAYLGKED